MQLPANISYTETGLVIPEGVSYDDWQSLGRALQQMERSVMWWIGDWVRYGERKWGEKYAQAIEATGYSYSAVSSAKSIAAKFDICRRRQNLSFKHHAEVAALPVRDADALLDVAEKENLSSRDLRAEVSRRKVTVGALPSADTCTVDDLATLTASGERFGCIYADPPWLYDNQGTRAATGNHYSGMTIDELCALPVRDLAAPDAHLHLWTTNGFLFECPKIFEAWGFEFRSSLVWVKPQMGIGNYWRNSHEILLTAIRGDAKRFNDKTLKSWIECDRGAHSAKPEIVRTYIERASPGPYLELFGRSPANGWTVWGNQIERGLLFHDTRAVA